MCSSKARSGSAGAARLAAETATSAKIHATGKLDFATIDLSEEDYRRFYVGFANSVLWPLLHFQPGLLEFDREDFEGYLAVNHTYAKALAELLRPDDLIWVHDYHLIPLAEASARAWRQEPHRLLPACALRAGERLQRVCRRPNGCCG